MVCNDAEKGRHSLVVLLSDDEGATWKYRRHLENDREMKRTAHYPSAIQARDGSIHVTYSYFQPEGRSIKHAHFNVEWPKQGDPK